MQVATDVARLVKYSLPSAVNVIKTNVRSAMMDILWDSLRHVMKTGFDEKLSDIFTH